MFHPSKGGALLTIQSDGNFNNNRGILKPPTKTGLSRQGTLPGADIEKPYE